MLYIVNRYLTLIVVEEREIPGAGTFLYFSERLALTAKASGKSSQWELPTWFYLRNGKYPLTYHSNMERWQRTKTGTRLNAVSKGQEFILDTEEFPEAIDWARDLLLTNLTK